MTIGKPFLRQAGVTLGVILVLAFLVVNLRSIDTARHDRVSANLSRVQELDSELGELVLKLRYGQLNNYDLLAATLDRIKRLKRELEGGEYAIAGKGEAEIDRAMAEFSRALLNKEILVEQFKSHNAVLRNSVYYLPRSVGAVSASPMAPESLRDTLQALLRDALLLQLGAAKDEYDRASETVGRLLTEQDKYPPPLRVALNPVIRHAQNILAYQQRMDKLIPQITSTQDRHLGNELGMAYSRSFDRDLNRANIYRFLLLLASMGLLAYAAHAFLRLRKNAARLAASESRYRIAANAMENAAEGIMISDADRRIAAVNKAFTAITGYTAEEVIGKAADFLHAGQDDAAIHSELWEVVAQTGRWQGEASGRKKSGETYPELRSVSAVRDAAGTTSHYVTVFTDTSSLKAYETRLQFLAQHDALTQLPNRAQFQDRCQDALLRAQRHGKPVGVVCIDLDRFKTVNDSLGHAMGDRLLQMVAERLRDCVREVDTVARTGGDEFVILLDEMASSRDAAMVSDKLLGVLSKPFTLDEHELVISASIGVSCHPEDGSDSQALLKNADAAMHHAKEQGRNTCRFFSADMNAHALETFVLTGQMRQALERNELLLHYQPRIGVVSGRIAALEALICWQHPERGLMFPVRFIPLLEETGMILEVGRWAIRQALADYREWHARGWQPPRIAVNVLPIQLRQKNFVDMVGEAIMESPRHGLDLIITESLFMGDIEGNIGKLRLLKDMGVNVAIGAFGTGHSPLAHLAKLPASALQIDRSFIVSMMSDPDSMTIVSTIISLAHALNLKVIAEGVDSEEQAKFLRLLKCDEIQGDLISKPVPAENIPSMLEERKTA